MNKERQSVFIKWYTFLIGNTMLCFTGQFKKVGLFFDHPL